MLSTPGFATRRHQSVTGFIELSYSDGKVLAWGRIGCLGPDVRTVGEVKVEEPALAVPADAVVGFPGTPTEESSPSARRGGFVSSRAAWARPVAGRTAERGSEGFNPLALPDRSDVVRDSPSRTAGLEAAADRPHCCANLSCGLDGELELGPLLPSV